MADAACARPAAYRPRRQRDSPLYRIAETHHETFKQVYDVRFAGRYGPWRAVVERTRFAFLDCGVEERGLAMASRVHAKMACNVHQPRLSRWPEPATRAGPKEVSFMIVTWQSFAVVLLAILVGALIPVLIQLRQTLKSAGSLFDTTGPKLDRTLDEVGEAAARINRLGKSLEQDAEGLRVFTDAAAGLGRSLKQAQESLRIMTAVGAAVGPAIAAGLRALFTPERDDDLASSSRPEGEPVTAGAQDAGRAADNRPGHLGKEASIGHE